MALNLPVAIRADKEGIIFSILANARRKASASSIHLTHADLCLDFVVGGEMTIQEIKGLPTNIFGVRSLRDNQTISKAFTCGIAICFCHRFPLASTLVT